MVVGRGGGRLAWFGLAAALLVPGVAWGATTGTSSGGDTADTSGTSTTGGDSTTGDPPGGEAGDESCGRCSANATQTVTIDSPADGIATSSPIAVMSTATPECYCDDCGCGDGGVWSQTAFLDDVQMGDPCMSDACSFSITAGPGEHVIRVDAEYTYETISAQITVEVAGGDPADGGADDAVADGGTGGTGGTGSAGQSDGGSKGGCTVGPRPDPGAVFWLALAFLGVRTSRRTVRPRR